MFYIILVVFTAILVNNVMNYMINENNPKTYILNKYVENLSNKYDKILTLTVNNDDLKKDMLEYIHNLIYVSSYYEFDIHFRNQTFLYYDHKVPNYLKYPNVTQYPIQYIDNNNKSDYTAFINEKNDKIDYYSGHFRNSYLTHINIQSDSILKKIIHKYFLYDILMITSHFFNALSQHLDFTEDIEYHHCNFSLTNALIDLNKNELCYPSHNYIYEIVSNELVKLNKRYKCFYITGKKCPYSTKKVKILDENNDIFDTNTARCCNA